MPSLHKSLMLSALSGLILLAFAADTSATIMPVKTNIAFEHVITMNKRSDITFGGVQTRPNDLVSMGADGNMRLLGKGEVLNPFGSPSVITIGDARNQMLNFTTGNS